MRSDLRSRCRRPFGIVLPWLLVATTACGRAPEVEYRTAATVREVMQAIVDPAADAIWAAVEIEATMEGTVYKRPETDEEWHALGRHALTLMEAGNLLLMPGRPVAKPGERAGDPRIDRHPDEIEAQVARDRSLWASHAQTLQAAADRTLQAIAVKDVTALVDAGEALDLACERCHQTYWYRESPQPVQDPPPRPER